MSFRIRSANSRLPVSNFPYNLKGPSPRVLLAKGFSSSKRFNTKDESKQERISSLNGQVNKTFDKLTANTANLSLTHVSQESILHEVAQNKAPHVLETMEKAKNDMMSKYDNNVSEMHRLAGVDDPKTEVRETELNLERLIIQREFINFAESKVTKDNFTSRQLEQYEKIDADYNRLLDENVALTQEQLQNLSAYLQALNSSDSPSNSEDSSSKGPDSPSESKGKGSLIDDYADPNLDQPSYMDGDD